MKLRSNFRVLRDPDFHIALTNFAIDRPTWSYLCVRLVGSAMLSPVACRHMGFIDPNPAEQVTRPPSWEVRYLVDGASFV